MWKEMFAGTADGTINRVFSALFGWLVPALWVVAIGSTATVVQRFAHAYREMASMDAGDALLREQKA